MALTDHSKALAMTGGLDAARLREQWLEIDDVAARHPEIRFLRSQEVDILADGTLDAAYRLVVEDTYAAPDTGTPGSRGRHSQ